MSTMSVENQDVEMDNADEAVDAQKKASEADALVLAGIYFRFIHIYIYIYIYYIW